MFLLRLVRLSALVLVVIAVVFYVVAFKSEKWLHVNVDFDVENNTIIVPQELDGSFTLIDLFYDRTYGIFKECVYASESIKQKHPAIKHKTCFTPAPHLTSLANQTSQWQAHTTSKLAFLVCFAIGFIHAVLGLATMTLTTMPCLKESSYWLPAVLAGVWTFLAALLVGLAGIFWEIICENYRSSDYYLKDRDIQLDLLETPPITYETYDFFKPTPVATVSSQSNGYPVVLLWIGVVLDLIAGALMVLMGMTSRADAFGGIDGKSMGMRDSEEDQKTRDQVAEGMRKRNLTNQQLRHEPSAINGINQTTNM